MKHSTQRILRATSVGIVASTILSTDQEAQVAGKTSKGLFIKTSDRRLVFVSFEPFKGPLTITLEGYDPALPLPLSGNAVRIDSQGLHIPDFNIRITIEGCEIWQPPPPSASQMGESERNEKLVWAAKEILLSKKGMGLADLIPPLVGLPDALPSLRKNVGLDRENIQQIQKYLRREETIALADRLSATMGSGPGLTPSADDFIVGLLLTMNRWKIPYWMSGHLHELNSRLVKAAYENTTTLSANLIESASLGLANERLINALDWVISGVPDDPIVIANLLGWGHSSGVDAFTGMAAAIKA